MSLNHRLGLLSFLGLVSFVIVMGPIEGLGKTLEFSESLIGKAWLLITLALILVPWLYAIEKLRKEKNTKWFWLCLMFWPISSYYLIKIREQDAKT